MALNRSDWCIVVTLRIRHGAEPIKEFWPARLTASRRNADPGAIEVVKDYGPYPSLASVMWAIGTDLAARDIEER